MTECLNCQGTGLQPNVDESLAERTVLCAICGGSGQVEDGEENIVTPETEEAEQADPEVTGTDIAEETPSEEAPVEQAPVDSEENQEEQPE